MLEYRRYLEANGAAYNTIRGKLSAIRTFTSRGVHPVDARVEDIVAFMSEEGKSQATRLFRFNSLKCLYGWLEGTGQILSNPMKKLKAPKAPSRLPKLVMTVGEAEKVLSIYPDDPSDPVIFMKRVMMEIMYSCSLRAGEVCALDLVDFDDAMNVLKVRHTKTHRNRIVPMGEYAANLLRVYIEEVRPDCSLPAIFINQRKRRVSSNLLYRFVVRARKLSGIRTKANSHSFRKSSATHMLKNGAPLRSVQALLGHAALTSSEVYTKVNNKDLWKMFKSCHPREREKRLRVPEIFKN